MPDEVAAKTRALITSGLDGAPGTLLDRMPNLELITVNSVGYDLVDMKKALARRIPVTHTPDVLTDDVADLAMGLMIMTSRKRLGGGRPLLVRAGRWTREKFPVTGKVTLGKKLGILGLGGIRARPPPAGGSFRHGDSYTDRAKLNSNYRFLPDLVSLAKESDFLMVATSAGPTPATWSMRRCWRRWGRRAS